MRLRRSRPGDLPPVVAVLVAAAAFAFLSGGYVPRSATPVAVALLVFVAVWVWLVRPQRPSRLYLAALAVFAAYTLWAGASIAWSFGPDLSWYAFDVCLLYLGVAAAVGLTPARRLQLRTLAFGFVALCVAVGGYAFAGKTVPDVVTHAHRYARLDAPVGYWNVLALLMVMGLTVAVALASRRRSPLAVRVVVAAAAVPMAFAFFFSYSRGGYLALGVALVVYFALSTTRLASLFTLAAVAGPVAAALWRVRGLETVFSATTDAARRASEGATLLRWALVALALTAAAQAALVLLQRGVPWPPRLRVAFGAAVLVAAAAAVVGGGWLYVRDQGGTEWLRSQYHAFATDSDERGSADTPARVFSLNTGRPPLWREAVEQYRVLPAKGTGAGTFVFTHERFRETGGVVKHAHSQWLNVLSELGWVGLALFVAALALFVAAAFRRLTRDRGDPERPLLAALQGGVLAFVVHISWDWDWDMAAAGTVFFLFAAASAAFLTTRGNDLADAARAAELREGAEEGTPTTAPVAPGAARAAPPGDRGEADDPTPGAGSWSGGGGHRRPSPVPLPLRVVLSGLALLAALSWLPPYLGERASERAVAAAGDGDLALAAAEAETARARDPLAVRPLITLALVQQQLGQGRAALATLDEAAALQPQNADVHYQRGLLLLNALGRPADAADAFVRALELDPLDDASAFQLSVALREAGRSGG